MSTLLILLLLFLGSYAASACFLWLGAKWAKVPQVTLRRAFGATLAIGMLNLLVHFGFLWLWAEVAVSPLLASGIEVGILLLLSWFTLKFLLRTSLWRAVGSWLPTLVPGTAAAALIYLVLWPHVLAAYITSTHAMAPTLLGAHQKGICPHCGQGATVSFNSEANAPREENRLGMCLSCQQAGIVSNVATAVDSADRFLVNKLLTPRRWDLVVFRSVEDPSLRYVKRLIGLPGEKVVIEAGGIAINGVKQSPPPEIAKLTFTAGPEGSPEGWGSPEKPLQLGNDEYFVLGDFSLRSSDSRVWGALPGKNLEGVASIIYWPPSRCRVLR